MVQRGVAECRGLRIFLEQSLGQFWLSFASRRSGCFTLQSALDDLDPVAFADGDSVDNSASLKVAGCKERDARSASFDDYLGPVVGGCCGEKADADEGDCEPLCADSEKQGYCGRHGCEGDKQSCAAWDSGKSYVLERNAE